MSLARQVPASWQGRSSMGTLSLHKPNPYSDGGVINPNFNVCDPLRARFTGESSAPLRHLGESLGQSRAAPGERRSRVAGRA